MKRTATFKRGHNDCEPYMFNYLISIFNRVNDRELANATLAFGSRIYKSLRPVLDVKDSDAISLQMELPLFTVSVVNAFVSLRRRKPLRIITNLTTNVLMAYAVNLEKITQGKIDATSYATKLALMLSDGPLEYTHIITEQSPEKQPELLINLFLARTGVHLNDINDQTDLCEGISKCLSILINDLKKAGV